MQTETPPLKAWLLLGLLALIWGSSFLLIKKGLLGFSPDQLAAIRIASAGFVLLPFILRRFKTVRPHHWLKLICVGLVGSFIPAFLFAFAQTELPSGVTGVLNTFTPLATLIIGVLIFRQPSRLQQWVGVVIGLLGTILLITASASGELEFNRYALLIIAATICYGLNLNLIKHHIPDLGALTITGVSLFLVAPPALTYLVLATPFVSQVAEPELWFPLSAILVLGIVGTAMALIIFNTVVKLTDTTFTSSVTYLIPIVALILGIIDGEPFFIQQGIGMAAILSGVWIANRRKRPPLNYQR
ncbi:DMT family transporter [Pseudidiomarina sp. 1APP75-32.1]|uniref:DMT family transporter n=1 Tax=Pseudidiomarina terrestris TaxID=2820060 RepID=A0AAW7R2J1_9GAMM|nr:MULTISPECIES: DMT family transporter [unclassified Pseudidiomarina]MDN7125415.1 DMT family transporter [Pseudidiomarina sp. 1APP75-32.1]MDN7130173.1 DMT family transporter [Pseudidiomarina sp. 1APR75-15]